MLTLHASDDPVAWADDELALRRQAEADTRTLAAQVLHYIKQGLASQQETTT